MNWFLGGINDIYPPIRIFSKAFTKLEVRREKMFSKYQESIRKNFESSLESHFADGTYLLTHRDYGVF